MGAMIHYKTEATYILQIMLFIDTKWVRNKFNVISFVQTDLIQL